MPQRLLQAKKPPSICYLCRVSPSSRSESSSCLVEALAEDPWRGTVPGGELEEAVEGNESALAAGEGAGGIEHGEEPACTCSGEKLIEAQRCPASSAVTCFIKSNEPHHERSSHDVLSRI